MGNVGPLIPVIKSQELVNQHWSGHCKPTLQWINIDDFIHGEIIFESRTRYVKLYGLKLLPRQLKYGKSGSTNKSRQATRFKNIFPIAE